MYVQTQYLWVAQKILTAQVVTNDLYIRGFNNISIIFTALNKITDIHPYFTFIIQYMCKTAK